MFLKKYALLLIATICFIAGCSKPDQTAENTSISQASIESWETGLPEQYVQQIKQMCMDINENSYRSVHETVTSDYQSVEKTIIHDDGKWYIAQKAVEKNGDREFYFKYSSLDRVYARRLNDNGFSDTVDSDVDERYTGFRIYPEDIESLENTKGVLHLNMKDKTEYWIDFDNGQVIDMLNYDNTGEELKHHYEDYNTCIMPENFGDNFAGDIDKALLSQMETISEQIQVDNINDKIEES